MKNNLPKFWIKLTTIMFVPAYLIIVWFWKDLILAAGESGIPFYHIYTVAASVTHTWNEGLIGAAAGYSIGDFYFYKLLSVFESKGFSDVFLQAILFFTMLILGEIGIYLLAKKIFPKKHFVFYLSSIIFYTFNLVVLVGVWNRLQYPFIVGYAFFPIILYLFIKGLGEKKLWYTLFINSILLLSSVAFTSIPLLELLWTVFLLYVIFYITIHFSNKKEILFSILFIVLLGLEWILFNSWWLIQFLQGLFMSSYTLQTSYGANSDINTFTTLSQHLGNIAYVIRLMHRDFFASITSLWNNSYQSVWMNVLTFVIPFLAFFPLLLKNKPKYIYFFLGFALIVVYFTKGSAEPFGWLFLFLFVHLRFLEALRNPFEKFSLLLPLAYAPLIGYSICILVHSIQKKWGKAVSVFATTFFIVIIILIAYPVVNGWLFTSTVKPANNKNIGYNVAVPSYYKQANDWLNSDHSSFRVIALPIDGEGITYNWKYGYSGVESSNGLFDKSFLSFTPSLEFLGDITSQLQYSLFNYPQYFPEIMSLLNAKYIMVRNDIDYKSRAMEDPEIINSYLSTASAAIIPSLVQSKNFGKLQFYKNTIPAAGVYVSNSYDIAGSQMLYSDVMSLANFQTGDIILNSDNVSKTNTFLGSQNAVLIGANTVVTINHSSFPIVSIDDARNALFYPHTLPSSPLYPLVRFKENVQTYANSDPDAQFFTDVALTNKRLGEFIAEVQLGSQNYSQKSYDEYNKSMITLDRYSDSTVLKNNIYYLRTQLLAEKINLEQLIYKSSQTVFKNLANNALANLETFSLSSGIEPRFDPQTAPNTQATDKVVYDFSVPSNGTYDVILKADRLQFHSSNGTILQIDNTLQNSTISQNGKWVNFGTIHLQKGIHEIQIPTENSQKLLKNETDNSVVISSTPTNTVIKTIPLQNIDPYGSYRVTFDFWFSQGSNARVGIGSTIEDKGNLGSYKDIGPDGYNNDFQTRSFEYTPNPNGGNYYIAFKVFPYNNCESINSQNPFAKSECNSNKGFYNLFGRPTVLRIKNLKVERIFTTDQAFLRQIIPQKKKALPAISVTKINSSEYSVSIKNAVDPYFLVLSQSFNPLWTAKIDNSNEVLFDHILVNSYANGWYVKKSGNYTITIEFSPEKYLIIGRIILALTLLAAAVMLFILWRKEKL